MAFDVRPYPQLTERHLANARVVPDRTQYLDKLPKGGTVVEVGVALGNFSKVMIDACVPKHFIGIDTFGIHNQEYIWGRTTNAVFNGKTHRAFYNQEMEEYAKKTEITILEGESSDQIQLLRDGSVDVVYVDADHSYEGSARDLMAVKNKMRDRGVICMNDYTLFDFLGNGTPYGVVQATNEFIVSEGWEVLFFALQPEMYCDLVIRKMI